MACGCKKKPKPAATVTVEAAQGEAFLASLASAVPDTLVKASCVNCVGLLRTATGTYIPMHTGDTYSVLLSDVKRWRSQGWLIQLEG